MAITKILVVRGYLGELIPYANNPEKISLENAIDYATNAAKTETTLMQSTLNCMPGSIHNDMLETKRRWGKESGVQAYHIIQSFAPGEVTPQTAHEIGCELARRVFGDRFEVVIATHLDKAHYHNHLVINSVSFADGRKYRNNFKDYFGDIRETTDALCREHGLSIPDGKKRGKRYGEWKRDNEDGVAWRDVIRRDIDEAIRNSLSMQQFYGILRSMGYAIDANPNHKYITVRPEGMERSVRLSARSLGEDYTPENIAKRILRIPYMQTEEGQRKRKRLRKPYKPIKLKGLRALYFRYCYELGLIKKKPRRTFMSKELRAEVRKLEGYADRMRLLHDYRIDTIEQVCGHRIMAQKEMEELARQRAALHHQKKGADDAARYELRRQTEAITLRLRKLRKEVKLCEAMEADAPALPDKIASIEKTKEEQAHHQTQDREQPGRKPRGPVR